MWIACFVSAFIHVADRQWVCCVIEPSCNSKQKKNTERRQQGRQKAVCCLATDTVDWRVGGTDPSVSLFFYSFFGLCPPLISSCSGCTRCLYESRRCTSGIRSVSVCVNLWNSTRTAAPQLLGSNQPKKTKKKQKIVRRSEELLTARAAGQMIYYIGSVRRRLCFQCRVHQEAKMKEESSLFVTRLLCSSFALECTCCQKTDLTSCCIFNIIASVNLQSCATTHLEHFYSTFLSTPWCRHEYFMECLHLPSYECVFYVALCPQYDNKVHLDLCCTLSSHFSCFSFFLFLSDCLLPLRGASRRHLEGGWYWPACSGRSLSSKCVLGEQSRVRKLHQPTCWLKSSSAQSHFHVHSWLKLCFGLQITDRKF